MLGVNAEAFQFGINRWLRGTLISLIPSISELFPVLWSPTTIIWVAASPTFLLQNDSL